MAWVPGGSSGSGGWIWVGDGVPDSPMPGGDYYGPTATTSDTDKPVEHGRVMLAVGEGPHAGLVNGLKSVYLNDVPVQNADGTLNFNDVSVAVVNGTLNQNPISGFEGAESEVGVGQKVLKATPIVRSISNTTATHARVKISVPSLQTIDTTTGKTSSAHLEYKIEVQPNGGSYQAVTLGDGGVIEKQFTSKLIKGYMFALPGTGPWNVRLTRVEVDSWSQYLQNDLYFESLSAIVDGNYSYPMTALIGVACNANQFTSIPKVTADWYGRIISVPANYDPVARTYATTGTGTTAGTWDGTFKQAWSDNPAWVFYDMVTNNLFGCGLTAGAPDKWLLYQIAQYCDVMVSDGVGGREPRFTCSVNIESRDEAIKVIGYLASIFRGSAYWAGGSVMPIQDKDEVPSAQFTNSNVVDGKFTYTSSAKPARHTACIVKYNDPTNSYESTPLLIQDNDAVARYGYNPLEVVAYGCSSRGQASRLGLMALTTELSQTDGITFSTAMEGIALRPGKIIKVHDAFRFGKRFGGRVMASTTTAVTLDAPVTLESGKTYQLSCTMPSGAVEVKAVSTGAGTVSSISVSSAFSVAPQVEGQWILVANDFAPLLYRVMGIKEGTDGAYEVTGLIHNPDKYAAVESGLILDAMPDASLAYHAPVTNLTLTESMAVQTDRLVSTLLASWTPVPDITGYTAVASRDGGPWQPMTIAGSGATLMDIQPGSWKVRVVARYATGDAVYTESSAYTTTGFSTTTSPAQSAQNGVNAINSADALTNSGKIALMESWKSELQTQARLDASATALGITTAKTEYDNAITALSTGLIAAGAPSNWAAVWPDGTTLSKTGIASSLATWWEAIASKRATLQVAISQAQSSAAQAAAISAAATDAASKVSDALTQAAADATAKAAAQKQAAIDAINASVGGVVPGATSASDAVSRLQTLANAAQASVTVPNPNFDQDTASNWAGMTRTAKADAPAGCPMPYCGRSQQRDNLSSSHFPVTPGQKICCEAWIDTTMSPYAASFGLYYTNAAGSLFYPQYSATAEARVGWTHVHSTYTVPEGAVSARAFCQVEGYDGFGSAFFTGLRVDTGIAAQSMATAAQAAAEAYADLKKTEANAYADGIVTAEETRAIADAQAKYDAAKSLADAAQAAANTAQAAANAAQGTANAAQTMPTYVSPANLPAASGFAPGYGPVLTSSDYSLWKVNAAANGWDRILFAATGLFGQVKADQINVTDTLRAAIVDAPHVNATLLTLMDASVVGGKTVIGPGSMDIDAIRARTMTLVGGNVIPNPFSEMDLTGFPATAYECAGVVSNGYHRSGTKCRYFESGGRGLYFADIPCAEGDEYYFEFWAWNTNVAGAVILPYLIFWDGAGNNTVILNAKNLGGGGCWQKCSVTGKAPAGTTHLMFHVNSNDGNGQFVIDDLYAAKRNAGELTVDGSVTAQQLAATLALLGCIQSRGTSADGLSGAGAWVPGSAGIAPQGFWLSGMPRTTTYIDGSTSANCYLEIGGDANFGGYKVATINTQVMTAVNRILNGSFWRVPAPWSAQPQIVQQLILPASQGGSVSPAAVTAVQSISAPGYTSGTIYLRFTPSASMSLDIGSGAATMKFRISVYLRNHATGVETLIYQTSGASARSSGPETWAPGQQSINVTSYLSSIPVGYGIACVIDQVVLQASTWTANATTYTGTVDVTGFELVF